MITLRFTQRASAAAIHAAVKVLKRGGVIALPTETVYGLACDPRNASAVRKIFRIKGRDDRKPLQLIAGSSPQVDKLAKLDRATRRVASRHWPGPLTLLVCARKGIKLPARVSPKGIIGIRVSSLALVKKIALALGSPLAATSANRSGKPPASSGQGVRRAFATGNRPDLLLDAGALPKRAPSTVARILPDGTAEILRQGKIRL